MSEIIEEHVEIIEKQKRITSPFMSKYEKARLIGCRAIQITIKGTDKGMDPLKIALEELKNNEIDLVVRRTLVNGDYEDWHASELKIFD